MSKKDKFERKPAKKDRTKKKEEKSEDDIQEAFGNVVEALQELGDTLDFKLYIKTDVKDDVGKDDDDKKKKEEVDFDDMDWDEMVEYADEKLINIPKKIKKGEDEDDLREFLEEQSSGDSDEDDDDKKKKEEVDFDDMDWDEMIEYADEKDIDIPKKIKEGEDEDDLREFLEEQSSGDDDDDDDDEEEEEEEEEESKKTIKKKVAKRLKDAKSKKK